MATGGYAKAEPLMERAQRIDENNTARFLLSGAEARKRSYMQQRVGNVFGDVSFSLTVAEPFDPRATDEKTRWSAPRYVAYVLMRTGEPEVIDLGAAETIVRGHPGDRDTGGGMTGIFISYRQADAKAWAISLRDDLAEVFGNDQVFLDKDTLHAGNWREQIQAALDRCKVVLVVIGPRWMTITDEQNRPRVNLPDDVHRQEIALALGRSDLTVIPVLVDDAPMPRAEHLPADLRKLTEQQARKIGDTQARRKADLAVLVKDIESVGGIQPRPGAGTPDRPVVPPKSPTRIGWLRLDMTTLGTAFALTLLAGMFAYLANVPLDVPELLFLLVVFYGGVLAVRWVWARVKGARRGRT